MAPDASGSKVASYRRAPPRGMRSVGSRGGIRLSDVLSAIRYALWCLFRALVDLWHLNPVSLVERRWRQLHPLNTRMALSVRPRLIDLATDFFLSDDRRKRQLLSWVKSMLPWVGEEDLFDFTASWQDGILLCALVETLSPGACPRFNLLKPHHRVNNCRLGITLAQKYLQVAQVPLSPEEMAIADEGCEVKICHLVQLLKWKYQKQGSKPTPFSNGSVEEPAPCKCYARGTGLRAGIVGRRTKFNILTDTVTRLSIQIEIRGPNNEYNKEKIVSMYAGSTSRYGGHVISTSASALSEDDGKTKVIEDGAGHSFIRQRSLDEDTGHLVIPFDYQCVGEGRFLVSYIPRSAGTHHITVLQQGEHVQGSPFEVKVSDWVSSWNLVPKPRVVPFDMLQTIEERPRDSLKPSSAATSDKIRRKLSQVAHVSKQLTMMKRRVLKKVITRKGEEIICDVTPSPTLSRQSSVDFSDVSDEDKRKAGSRSLSLSQESAKSIGKVSGSSAKTTDKLSVSASEKHPSPRKSPRKSKNKPKPEQSPRVSFEANESKEKATLNQSKSASLPAAGDFANIVSLAMQTASSGKATDTVAGGSSQQNSCPIKLQVTQYETESDGNSSDIKTKATSASHAKIQVENRSTATNNTTLVNSQNVKVTKPSDSVIEKPMLVYNPRALCSKRPPSLTSAKSTSSSLSSIDKLPCVDPTVFSASPAKASDQSVSAVAKNSHDKSTPSRAQFSIPEENKPPKFTASSIVGTFLDTLSRGKKSGLVKSGSVPTPTTKDSSQSTLANSRGDSDARTEADAGAATQLFLQAHDVEGEPTISQLQRMKHRSMSVSSQSSSSSHPTRNPSQTVSPSPSRNVSPSPSRNVSPSPCCSRNVSPSPSPLTITSSRQPISISPSQSRNVSPSHNRRTRPSPSINVSPPSSDVSPSRSKESPRSVSVIKPPSHSKNTCRSRSGSPNPLSENLHEGIDSVTVCISDTEKSSVNSRESGDGISLESTNPTPSLTLVSLSNIETGDEEMNSRDDVFEPPAIAIIPLKESSSQFRPPNEDGSILGDGGNAQKQSDIIDPESFEENERVPNNINGIIVDNITIDLDRLQNDTMKDNTLKVHGSVGNGSNGDIDKASSSSDLGNYKTKSDIQDLCKGYSDQLVDEGIVVTSSSNSNSNTDEHLETQLATTEPKIDIGPDNSIEENKKRHTIFVADKDEQDLIDGDLDFNEMARRRGSASFDFSDYKPRHKITWSQHRSFSQERKLRKSLSCPSRSIGGIIPSGRDRMPSLLARKRVELSLQLADCSSTSESGEEAKTKRERFRKDNAMKNSEGKNGFGPNRNTEISCADKNTFIQQNKQELKHGTLGTENSGDSLHNNIENGDKDVEDEINDFEQDRQTDKKTTKYHIQLISASDVKSQETSSPENFTHTWSSFRGSSRTSFGKLRRKSSRGHKSFSVNEARHGQHPYFFSLGDDPGSDVHSDDLFSRGKTDQMMVTGSSSPTSSCASASTAVGKSATTRATSAARRGRLARSKKWNTFDGDSLGSQHASLSITGGNMSLDQAIESGHSSSAGSDGADNGSTAQMRHLMNSLKRRRASEGTGLKAEDHEDEEGDEEDDEVLQIVIESKVLEYSNSPRKGNDDEFGNDDDAESILPQSLTSGPTGDHSSLTHYESNGPTSVENSPLSHLGAPAILSIDPKNPTSAIVIPNIRSQLGFPVESVSPLSGVFNKSDNSDWSDEDELLAVNGEPRPGVLMRLQKRSQEDRVRGDWSPRLVDFSCTSGSLPSQEASTSAGPEATSTLEVRKSLSSITSQEHAEQKNSLSIPTASQGSNNSKLGLATPMSSSLPSEKTCSASNSTYSSTREEEEYGTDEHVCGNELDYEDHGRSRVNDEEESPNQSSVVGNSLSNKRTSAFKTQGSEDNVQEDDNVFLDNGGSHIEYGLSSQGRYEALDKCIHPECFQGSFPNIEAVTGQVMEIQTHPTLISQTPHANDSSQNGYSCTDRSPFQDTRSIPGSLRMRRMPLYGCEESQIYTGSDKAVLSPRNAEKKTEMMVMAYCKQCRTHHEENVRSKPLASDSLKSNIFSSVSSAFSSPKNSTFFSRMDMLSPTASVCAASEIWSTLSNSYTADQSDPTSRENDLSDACSNCPVCEEMKLEERNPDGCEADTERAGYFTEKTLTPTKYRRLRYGVNDGDIFGGKSAKLASSDIATWASRLTEEKPSKARLGHNDDGMFCFRCVDNSQMYHGRHNSRVIEPYTATERGDVLLTPTKFKQTLHSRSVGSGLMESDSQTCGICDSGSLYSWPNCSSNHSPIIERTPAKQTFTPLDGQSCLGFGSSGPSTHVKYSPRTAQSNGFRQGETSTTEEASCPLCCIAANMRLYHGNLLSSQRGKGSSQQTRPSDHGGMVHITHFDVYHGVYKARDTNGERLRDGSTHGSHSGNAGSREFQPNRRRSMQATSHSHTDSGYKRSQANPIRWNQDMQQARTSLSRGNDVEHNGQGYQLQHPHCQQKHCLEHHHQNHKGLEETNGSSDDKHNHSFFRHNQHKRNIHQQSEGHQIQHSDWGDHQTIGSETPFSQHQMDYHLRSYPPNHQHSHNSHESHCNSTREKWQRVGPLSDTEPRSPDQMSREALHLDGKTIYTSEKHSDLQHHQGQQQKQQLQESCQMKQHQYTNDVSAQGNDFDHPQKEQRKQKPEPEHQQYDKTETKKTIGSAVKKDQDFPQHHEPSSHAQTLPQLLNEQQQQHFQRRNQPFYHHHHHLQQQQHQEGLKQDRQPVPSQRPLHHPHIPHQPHSHHHNHQRQNQQNQHHQPHHQQELQHFNVQGHRVAGHAQILRRESTVDTFDSGITEGSLPMIVQPAANDSRALEDSLLGLDFVRDLDSFDIDRPLRIPPL